MSSKRWGPIPSILLFVPLLIGIPYLTLQKHYALPEPLKDLRDSNGRTQLSEAAILGYAKYLSEDIGFRTVGTREHALGDSWMLSKAEELKKLCEDKVKAEPGRKLECEVWRQEGSGSHRFDILGKRLYKTYVNLSNIVLRISDGSAKGKEHAVLVNAHLDSTLPSPGAADDAISVGVLIEVARNLIETPGWEPAWSIVFLWNNAEESLQDGSHLFSTQHPIKDTVRAIINLEACGTTGPEILFQATSEEMIEAYSKVPRPYGTVVANDIFSSGIIMSDTDFRQFELYLNTTGLDMAIVGHSYFYHTRKDLVEFIEPGAAQHMAENTLALLQYLSSEGSPIPRLTGGYTKPTTAFFSFFNTFFVQYSFQTANAIHVTLFVSTILFIVTTYKPHQSPINSNKKEKTGNAPNGRAPSHSKLANGHAYDIRDSIWMEYIKGVGILTASAVGSLLGVCSVAFVMAILINRPLSWFAIESSCLILYAPASLTGALLPLNLLAKHTRERTLLNAVLLSHSLLALLIQAAGIGSSGLFFLSGTPILAGLLLERFMSASYDDVWLGTYVLGQLIPISFGTELFSATADFFVPLTGRMGAEAPAEFIIALMVGSIGLYIVPLAVPFCHRFGRKFVRKATVLSGAVSAIMIILFSLRSPFDAMHPKRLYVIHSENVTTGEVHVRMAAADGAPKFDSLVNDMAAFVGGSALEVVADDMHEYNTDWDVFYPFSAFLSPYTITLPAQANAELLDDSITVKAVNSTVDLEKGVRRLRIEIVHPGVIWSTIAFDAHVLEWSLDDNPPSGRARHYIKEASFYGEDTWHVDLVVKLENEESAGTSGPLGSLQVNYVGIREKAMWPGKQSEKALGGEAMALFERLDAFLQEHTGGTVDATLLGCIGGVAVI
ncbi:hypothetical protein SCHPADRAFT_920864 [Schizopora paradoxa]|uniref:Peptide hydrolase n=1 Tax=Schizopora paradoxa TaxID=27342 RepID=A0A0H2RQV8_9AGAM|nr:hypothetical protein SCHPADRAFT_920864 [Schizopora paradoxa]